ncbi:MAG: DNA polymerase III subunit delta' [Burkholderiales bacterium]|nr:DNA polymerase III subunit delta' [Burkholderiales bacterium]
MLVGADGALPLPWLAAPLAQALAQPGHALLVVGAPGVGALELQMTLAQAWLCEARPAGAPAAPPCGRCASCRLVQARTHADLRVLLPEAQRVARGWEPAGEGGEGKRKPSRWIRIAEVREAIAWAATTSGRARAKVLLLHPGEALQREAASALLKTLEEPPSGMRIVLSCTDPERLLPTVRSRCQRVRLPAPAAAQAAQWLAARGLPDPAVLLSAANGGPLDALALHGAGIDAAAWAALPRALADGRSQAWADWPLPRALEALHKLCHDLMAVACGAAPRYFPAPALEAARPGGGRTEALRALRSAHGSAPPGPAARAAAASGDSPAAVASPPATEAIAVLARWADALVRALSHAEHPWNEALLIESLVAQGREALGRLRA